MRIVALADTHLRRPFVSGVSGAPGAEHSVPDGDVLVHAGDLLQHGSLEELERAVAFLRGLPHRTKILVAGNHEICLQKRPVEARAMLEAEGIVYLEDASFALDGIHFYGSPWQPKFRFWAFGAERGPALAAKWRSIPDHVDVLVTHGPPHGFGDRVTWKGVERRVGCPDLARRAAEVAPSLHVFGHIHQDPGTWVSGGTTYANVTTDEGAHPARVFDVIRTRPSERPSIRPWP